MKDLLHTNQQLGVDIQFMNNTFVLEPSGCLFWKEESLLLVSDLHLEKGHLLQQKKAYSFLHMTRKPR